MKNTETGFGGNSKVALILTWQRRECSRLTSQELVPTLGGIQGHIQDESSWSRAGDEEQRG